MLKCTASLIQSAQFAVNMRNNPNWGTTSFEGLKKTLARQYDPDPKMEVIRKRGEAFEGRMYQLLDDSKLPLAGNLPEDFVNCIQHIREVGYYKQKWHRVTVETTRGPVTFRGASDIMTKESEPIMYDIKTCSEFKRSKYLDSIQHVVYMAAEPKVTKFVYMVWELGPPELTGYKPVYKQVEVINTQSNSYNLVYAFEDFLNNITLLGLDKEYESYCES